MFRQMIAGATALTLVFASAAPLQAQELSREDTGKLLFGLAAIAVLGAVLDAREDRNDRAAQSTGRGIDPAQGWADLNRDQDRRNAARRILPGQCLQTIPTRFGDQRMFGRRCLERTYAEVDRLPERCAVRVYTADGPRNGFDPLCLREQGYQSDRRH